MKVYFEDGELRSTDTLPIGHYVIINATSGASHNIALLDDLRKTEPNTTIYTNSIFAFSNIYAWNEELKAPEIYIRSGKQGFTRIDKLTTRELKEGHNLAKMYIAGEFDMEAPPCKS